MKQGLTQITLGGVKLRSMTCGVLLLCLTGLALGFFSATSVVFDAFSHLRTHLTLGALLIGAVLAASRLRLAGIVGVLAAFTAFLTTLPAYLPQHQAEAGNGEVLRFLQLNVRHENTTPERVLALLQSAGVDVVTLDEISDELAVMIERLAPVYPFRFVCPRDRLHDTVAILSKLRQWPSSQPLCAADGAFASAVLEWKGGPLEVAAVHLFWPWPFGQAEQIDRLMPVLATPAPRLILAGDLNAVPWSATADRVASVTRSQLVTGYGPTWLPKSLPNALMPLGLPIDHVFLKGLKVRSARTLDPVGSDHLPVYVEISE